MGPRPTHAALVQRTPRLARGAQGRALLAALAALSVACGPPVAVRDTTELATPNLEARNGGAPVQFDYPTLDGQHLSTESLAGRVGVIAFLAAYDDASLAQARFLVALARHHAPRLNVALLFLDPEENRPLVEAFVASLKLPLPSAIADRATVAGNGPFEGLHHVPSIVILDRKGAEAFRNIGLIQERDIDAAVKEVEKR